MLSCTNPDFEWVNTEDRSRMNYCSIEDRSPVMTLSQSILNTNYAINDFGWFLSTIAALWSTLTLLIWVYNIKTHQKPFQLSTNFVSFHINFMDIYKRLQNKISAIKNHFLDLFFQKFHIFKFIESKWSKWTFLVCII